MINAFEFRIETPRLIMRLAYPSEAATLIAFYQENQAHLGPWEPTPPPDYYTEAHWRKRIQAAIDEYDELKSVRLNLFLKQTTELVGMANFTNFERGPFQNCRLGYKLGRKFEGQGLMAEGLKAAMDHVFVGLGFHRIEANFIPTNLKSEALLKRMGFVFHGVAAQYLQINGAWQDHMLTSRVNPAWNSAV